MRKFDNMVDLNAPLFNARVKAIFADALVLAGVLPSFIPVFDKPRVRFGHSHLGLCPLRPVPT